jgi:hypothetical protein
LTNFNLFYQSVYCIAKKNTQFSPLIACQVSNAPLPFGWSITGIAAVKKRNEMAKKKKAINNNSNGFEKNLWDTANRLRGSVESSEYKHVVLRSCVKNLSKTR